MHSCNWIYVPRHKDIQDCVSASPYIWISELDLCITFFILGFTHSLSFQKFLKSW
jgi:hypothetical protein